MKYDKIVIKRKAGGYVVESVEESTVDNVPDAIINTYEAMDINMLAGYLTAKMTDMD